MLEICATLVARSASIHIYSPSGSHALLQFDHGSAPHDMALANERNAATSPVGGTVPFGGLDTSIGVRFAKPERRDRSRELDHSISIAAGPLRSMGDPRCIEDRHLESLRSMLTCQWRWGGAGP